jgi:hypothetical protein
LHDAKRRDGLDKRPEFALAGRDGTVDVRDGDQVDRRRRGAGRDEVDVVRVGPHPEARRQALAAGGRRRLRVRLGLVEFTFVEIVVSGRDQRGLLQEDTIEVGHGATSVEPERRTFQFYREVAVAARLPAV